MAVTRKTIWNTVLGTAVGAGVGYAVGRSMAWTTVGAVVGVGTTALILIIGIKPVVAIPVALGAGIGAYLGGTVVAVLCRPEGCSVYETGASFVTGVGALVGIGLVVALATRSFEEYNEAQRRNAPPPTTGCSTGED